MQTGITLKYSFSRPGLVRRKGRALVEFRKLDRYLVRAILITGLTTVCRLSVIGKVGLGDDEAHYWMWSKRLDWSYYDHPPMVAWIIAFFTGIGGDREYFVRVGAVLLFVLSSLGIYKLAKEIKDEKTACYSILFLNISPVFSFLGSVLMVPDGPLSAAWIFFLLFFHRAVRNPEPVTNWILSGTALGIGFLSKYNAILLPVSAFLFLLFSGRHRRLLLQKGPYLALLVALLLAMPVLVWNARHHWASFGFQLGHGLGSDSSFSLTLFFQILGAQLGYVSPILFILSFAALYLSGRRGIREKDDDHLFLFFFGATTILFFDAIGSFHRILPHWPALGFITAFIALALWIENRPGLNRWKNPAIVFGIFLTILIPLQALTFALPITKYFGAKADPTNDLYGWADAAQEIRRVRDELAKEGPVFIYAYKFLIADQVGFYTGKNRDIYCFNEDRTQFDFWDDPEKLIGQNGLFVTDNRYEVDPAEKFGRNFARFEKLPPLRVYRNGQLIRTFYFYKSYGFKGLKI